MNIPKFNKAKANNDNEKEVKKDNKSISDLASSFNFKKLLDKNKNNQSNSNTQRGLQVKLPGCNEYVPLGAWQYKKKYSDSLGKHLIVIIDEAAELLQAEGGKSAEAKEIAAMQAELETCIKSLTQLGRSSGISVVIATQRNDSSIIPGVIQNNPLAVDTKIKILRPVNMSRDISNINKKINADKQLILSKFANDFGIDYNENGIVFDSKEDKEAFFRDMRKDAIAYDESNNSLIMGI